MEIVARLVGILSVILMACIAIWMRHKRFSCDKRALLNGLTTFLLSAPLAILVPDLRFILIMSFVMFPVASVVAISSYYLSYRTWIKDIPYYMTTIENARREGNEWRVIGYERRLKWLSENIDEPETRKIRF